MATFIRAPAGSLEMTSPPEVPRKARSGSGPPGPIGPEPVGRGLHVTNRQSIFRPDDLWQVHFQPPGGLLRQGGDDESGIARVRLDLVVDRRHRRLGSDPGVDEIDLV